MRKSTAIKDIRAFNRFYTNIIGVIDHQFLASPFSLTEVRILYEIAHDRQATGRKIADFLRVDEGYLSRTIDKLVRQGLVKRRASAIDRRTRYLALSRSGRSVFRDLDARSETAVGNLIKPLTAAEVVRLRSMLRRVQTLLSKEASRDH